MRPALVLAVVLALLAAPPAMANADRADARAFARATTRVHKAAQAHDAEIKPLADRYNSPECQAAIDGVPAGDASAAALDYTFTWIYQLAMYTTREDLLRFSRELDAIDVKDPTLRAGRAGWRRQIAAAQDVHAPAPDFCDRLEAWGRAGYPVDQAPAIDDPGVDAFNSVVKASSKKIERAGKRLRKLGVKRSVAKRWDTVFQLVDD